jgi:hypothetical protein
MVTRLRAHPSPTRKKKKKLSRVKSDMPTVAELLAQQAQLNALLEEARKKEEEAARQKAAEEAEKQKAAEEAERQKAAEEAKRKKAAEEAERRSSRDARKAVLERLVEEKRGQSAQKSKTAQKSKAPPSTGASGKIRRPRSRTPESDISEGGEMRSCINCTLKRRTCTWEKRGKSKACVPCRDNKQGCNGPDGKGFRKRARDESEDVEVGPSRKKARGPEAAVTPQAWWEAVGVISEMARNSEVVAGEMRRMQKAIGGLTRNMASIATSLERLAASKRDGTESESEVEAKEVGGLVQNGSVGENAEETMRTE